MDLEERTERVFDSIVHGNSKRAVELITENPMVALTNTRRDDLPLLISATEENLRDVVEALLEAGASPDATGRWKETSLHWASLQGNAETVQILLDKGADVNAQDDEGATPLHVSITNGATDVARLLLERGANPTTISAHGDTPESLARKQFDPSIIELLDNPPALRQYVGRRQRRTKLFDKPEPENETICAHFKGVLWFPTTDSQPTVCRVWDLIYGDKASSGFPTNRWIHLPSNNPRWLQHVVRNIVVRDYQNSNANGHAILEKVDEFIEQQFPETGEGTTSVKSCSEARPGLKLLSLVVPTLDVDLENDTRAKLCERAKTMSSEEAKSSLDKPRYFTSSDKPVLSHIRLMDEMNISYSKLGIRLQSPRSIYEPHSTSGLSKSSKAILGHRIRNQVLCNHLQRSEGWCEDGGVDKRTLPSETKQQYISSYQNDGSNLARRKSSIATFVTDKLKDPSRVQSVPEKQNGSPNQAGQGLSTFEPNSQQRKVVPASYPKGKAESMLHGIVIAQLWVLMIYVEGRSEKHSSGGSKKPSLGENSGADEEADTIEGKWTVITAFPERWDPAIVPSLQSTIRNSLFHRRVGLEETNVTQLIEQILFSCVNFTEETIVLGEPVTYSNVFAAAIARLSDDLARRYENLRSKAPNTLKYDLIEEVNHLKSIDDITYELDVFKRVLSEQEYIMDQFTREISLLFYDKDSVLQDSSSLYVHPALKVYERLGAEARTVRESLITLLDLKDRFTNIENSRKISNQTIILLLTFTVATVIFSPLLLTVALLALKVDGFPDVFDPGYIVKACVSSLVATVVLIGIFLEGYMIYLTCCAPKKASVKSRGGRGSPPSDRETTEKHKGGRESEPLSSWQNTVTTKSNNLFAHLKFRNRGRDKGQKDEENGKPAGVIEGKEKEPEK